MSNFLNKCVTEGKLPVLLNLSVTFPLLKPSKPQDKLSSYRPICIENQLLKILEKIILNRHLEIINSRIPISQYGFRKECSTSHLLFDLITDIKEKRYSVKSRCLLCLDVSSAFNKMDGVKLLQSSSLDSLQ